MSTRFERLAQHWVYGGSLAGLILLLLTPIVARGWSPGMVLTFLCLPAYMIHQYEEHDADRFRLFVGEMVGVPDALTVADVFWINVVGVWVVLVGIMALAFGVNPGWGVMAAWFLLINGLGHVVQAIALRRPNPGVWTALVLFLPLGIGVLIGLRHEASVLQHGLSIFGIVLLHLAIILRVAANRRRAAG